MSEWKQPHQRLEKCIEPRATGRGLGIINRKYFEPATWEPLLSTEMGRGQYSKFVASMIERIQLQESNYDEIRSLVHLVATEHNWDFMTIALPRLPELKDRYPHDAKSFEVALLFLLKPKLRRRSMKEIENAIPASKTYENGLSKAEEQFLRRDLFGPDRGAVDSPSMTRLFKSTLELGYPQPALDQLMCEAKIRGTDIERCCNGLPTNLRMPNADQFPSSSHIHWASSSGIGNPDTHARRSVIPSSSAIEANDAPREANLDDELLTELVVDGVVDPALLLTTPNETRTPYGQLLLLEPNGIEDTEAILFGQAGSQNSSEERPPGIRRGPAEPEEVYYGLLRRTTTC